MGSEVLNQIVPLLLGQKLLCTSGIFGSFGNSDHLSSRKSNPMDYSCQEIPNHSKDAHDLPWNRSSCSFRFVLLLNLKTAFSIAGVAGPDVVNSSEQFLITLLRSLRQTNLSCEKTASGAFVLPLSGNT
jgi:hypothetical protein